MEQAWTDNAEAIQRARMAQIGLIAGFQAKSDALGSPYRGETAFGGAELYLGDW